MFAVPNYRRLWTARTISQWGDTFNFVALALLIYDLTGSSLGVAGLVVAEIHAEMEQARTNLRKETSLP